MRIFAGPNGSGKSSLLKSIPKEITIGYYINPDNIEKSILTSGGIDLNSFGIDPDEEILKKYFRTSDFVKKKAGGQKFQNEFYLSDGVIRCNKKADCHGYTAAIIADFIREENLKAGNDFSFETVMSHPGKLDFIVQANKQGYHVYLYYVCTDDVRVNIDRVRNRVREGGHYVSDDKIKERYTKSLRLLYSALKLSYKSYLFDNSYDMKMIIRINRDKVIDYLTGPEEIPNWIKEYVLS